MPFKVTAWAAVLRSGRQPGGERQQLYLQFRQQLREQLRRRQPVACPGRQSDRRDRHGGQRVRAWWPPPAAAWKSTLPSLRGKNSATSFRYRRHDLIASSSGGRLTLDVMAGQSYFVEDSAEGLSTGKYALAFDFISLVTELPENNSLPRDPRGGSRPGAGGDAADRLVHRKRRDRRKHGGDRRQGVFRLQPEHPDEPALADGWIGRRGSRSPSASSTAAKPPDEPWLEVDQAFQNRRTLRWLSNQVEDLLDFLHRLQPDGEQFQLPLPRPWIGATGNSTPEPVPGTEKQGAIEAPGPTAGPPPEAGAGPARDRQKPVPMRKARVLDNRRSRRSRNGSWPRSRIAATTNSWPIRPIPRSI